MRDPHFTTLELVEWLRRQPDVKFNPSNPYCCAVACFLEKVKGAKDPVVYSLTYSINGGPEAPLPFQNKAHCTICHYHELALFLETHP
jgi:hypothetical protein